MQHTEIIGTGITINETYKACKEDDWLGKESRKCICNGNECCDKCSAERIKTKKDRNLIETLDMPVGARNLEVFHIDKEKKEAYIGYKITNGNFHFISVPYTGK